MGRTYHYRMHVSPDPPSIFEQGRVWHVAASNGTGIHVGNGAGGDGGKRGGDGVTCGDGGTGDGDGDGRWGGLDIDAMRDAASRLLGTHDFSSFRANGGAMQLSNSVDS